MSFLIRRNLPLAWAGWRDSFQRPPENPLQHPWKHLGGGESYINDIEELVVTEQVVNSDGRGPSFEWMPFTPNWGFEMEFWYPVEGLDTQNFLVAFTNTWVNVESTYLHAPMVVFRHNPVAGGQTVWYTEADSMFSEFVSRSKQWSTPTGFTGQTLTLRVWVENDEYMRIWLNGYYVGSSMVSPDYALGPGRRCIRLINRSYCNVWIRWVHSFDRPGTVPPKTVWSSIFYDDFDRDDGTVGNGWTQLGTDAGLVSGKWAHTGTATNSVGLIRDVTNLNGQVRVEAVVSNVTDLMDGSLIACCNSAGTQALVANFRSNHVYLGRMSSSVNGTPSFTDFQDGAVTIANGDTIALYVYAEIMWFEVNGVPKLYAGNVHNVVPATNQYAGLRVRRDGSDSAAFNDIRIYSGVGI
ncbi:hypothetical protein [Nocardia sp. NPDC060249]|uniref:hypothetical protein n=1 Tax=Nocardia sp. NPDC060249 TaxID=3347082 RepID=UPI00365C2133